MSAHTKGPWTVHHSYDVGAPSTDRGLYEVEEANENLQGDFDDDHLQEAEANRRLIATAPELLDACRGLIKMMDDGLLVRDIRGDGQTGWAIKQLPLVMAVKAATEAIAKATGDGS